MMLQVEGATVEWSFMQNDGWMNGWMVGGTHSIHSSIHQLWAPPTIHPSIHPIVDGWINHLTSQKVDVLKFWMHTMEVLLPDKSNNRHHDHDIMIIMIMMVIIIIIISITIKSIITCKI